MNIFTKMLISIQIIKLFVTLISNITTLILLMVTSKKKISTRSLQNPDIWIHIRIFKLKSVLNIEILLFN